MTGMELALKAAPLLLKGWPLLQKKLEQNFTLYKILDFTGLASNKGDFANIYNKALQKIELYTPPNVFALFKEQEVRAAFENDFTGGVTAEAIQERIRAHLYLDDHKFTAFEGSINEDIRRFRGLLVDVIVDGLSPQERLAFYNQNDIREGIVQTQSLITEGNLQTQTKMQEGFERISREIEGYLTKQIAISIPQEAILHEQDFDEDITAIGLLLKEKMNRAAITQLESFKTRKWGMCNVGQHFKIQANLGLAYFELGEREISAEYFTDLPNHSQSADAFGLAALGYALKGECGQADVFADKAIAIDPGNSQAWSAKLQCLQGNTPIEEVESMLGSDRLRDPMIGLAVVGLINAYHPQKRTRALEILAGLDGSMPPDTVGYNEILEQRSVTQLMLIIEGTPQDISTEPGDVEILKQAINGLTVAWDFYSKGDLRSSKWSVLTNRGTAYRQVGEYQRAKRDYYAALHEFKHFFTYRQLLQLMLKMGEPVIDLFAEMDQELTLSSEEQHMFVVGKVHAYNIAGMHEKLLQVIPNEDQVVDSSEAKWLIEVKVTALSALGRKHDALKVAVAGTRRFPDDSYVNYMAAAMAFDLDEHEQAEAFIKKAASILVPDADLSEGFIDSITALLYEYKCFNEVIHLVGHLPMGNVPSKISLRLLSSLAQTDHKAKAYALAEQLYVPANPDSMVAEIMMEKHNTEGHPEKAFEIASKMTDIMPHAPFFYLSQLKYLVECGQLEEAKSLLMEMPLKFDFGVNALDILSRAIIAAGGQFLAAGMELGYYFRQHNLTHESVHIEYVQFYASMVQQGYEDRAPEKVVADAHVTLKAVSDHGLLETNIEMGDEADGSVRPDSELGMILVDRAVGDEVMVRSQLYKVKGVDTKFSWAFLTSREKLHIRLQ